MGDTPSADARLVAATVLATALTSKDSTPEDLRKNIKSSLLLISQALKEIEDEEKLSSGKRLGYFSL